MRKELSVVLLTFLFLIPKTQAMVWVVQAVDNDFRPNLINLHLGDTVKWQWVNGVHTTSSNGIPFTAQPWNALLDSTHTSFTYVVTVTGIYNYVSVLNVPLMSGVFSTSVTGIDDVNTVFGDVKAWWNSSGHEAIVQFSMKENAMVKVDLINLNGDICYSFQQGGFASSIIQRKISTSQLPSGYYFIVLNAEDGMIAKKIFIE
jgi:plastocyanin